MLRKSLVIACAIAFTSALAPGTATAQDGNVNQKTYFTFSGAVELPGKTLPAGTYVFRVADSPSNRHIVQVFDKDEKDIIATLLAIPAQRLQAADDPEVRFMEVAANQPAAIRTWWFPGRTVGHEFIYPKDQATRLARATKSPVLTVATDASTTESMRDAELARVNESAETSTFSAEQTASAPTGTSVSGRASAETQTAVNTPPPAGTARTTMPQSQAVTQRPVETTTPAPATTTEPVVTERTALPRTATVLPLVALLGLGSLAGAAALRIRRK
jgi:hypothetical protein